MRLINANCWCGYHTRLFICKSWSQWQSSCADVVTGLGGVKCICKTWFHLQSSYAADVVTTLDLMLYICKSWFYLQSSCADDVVLDWVWSTTGGWNSGIGQKSGYSGYSGQSGQTRLMNRCAANVILFAISIWQYRVAISIWQYHCHCCQDTLTIIANINITAILIAIASAIIVSIMSMYTIIIIFQSSIPLWCFSRPHIWARCSFCKNTSQLAQQWEAWSVQLWVQPVWGGWVGGWVVAPLLAHTLDRQAVMLHCRRALLHCYTALAWLNWPQISNDHQCAPLTRWADFRLH